MFQVFPAIPFEGTDTENYSSALVQAKDSNGKSIFEGKRFTAFTNAEETTYGLTVEVGRSYFLRSDVKRTLTTVTLTRTL